MPTAHFILFRIMSETQFQGPIEREELMQAKVDGTLMDYPGRALGVTFYPTEVDEGGVPVKINLVVAHQRGDVDAALARLGHTDAIPCGWDGDLDLAA